MSTPVRRFPRVMPLLRVAREILKVDQQEVYKQANNGMLHGAFKVGAFWFVHVPTMIRAMQTPKATLRPEEEEGDPLEGLLR